MPDHTQQWWVVEITAAILSHAHAGVIIAAVNVNELQELLRHAEHAARNAGEVLSEYASRLSTVIVEHKSSSVDLVSEADRNAEDLIRKELCVIAPTVGFIGEESEPTDAGESELSWVVDPLDGTSNFLAGLPLWCVSIALCDSQLTPLLGVVHAPMLHKTWTAAHNAGAFENGQPISVRIDPPGGGLQNAMLATGFPYSICSDKDNSTLDRFTRMQRHFHKIRRLGSAAIDLALVACGTFDGLWETCLKPWDTAAGMLIVTEAGGFVERFDGSPYRPGDSDLLVAATPELRDEIRSVLK